MFNEKEIITMGLIKLAFDIAKGSLSDQWKEYFTCDSIDNDVLMVRGQKRTQNGANVKSHDNVISNGSVVAVADGQCMLIVENGKVVEVCAEPGAFTYNSSTEPSIFAGKLGTSILDTVKQVGKRFTFGGETAQDQRVYYINIKDIVDNKFGTATPIPFRVVDSRIGLDVDVSVRCNGIYTYKIVNPVLFYTNIAGNVESSYMKDELAETLRADLLNGLGPALAEISNMEVRPNQLVGKNIEIGNALRTALTEEWGARKGIELVKVAFNSVSVPKEDEDMIKSYQQTAVLRDPGMAAATLVGSQARAMEAAASNENGAMMGFMGMNMAQMAGGMNSNNLFQMDQQNKMQQQQMAMQQAQAAQPTMAPASQATADSWTCVCGAVGTGRFCMECGKGKPEPIAGWACSCGATNTGKFCPNCGAKKPADAPTYVCDKCGWVPADPKNPPKFCPECGDIFDENDAK